MPTVEPAVPPLPLENRGPATSDEALAEALKTVPRGAFALAGLTVGLLMLSWLFVYVFIFLARGSVS